MSKELEQLAAFGIGLLGRIAFGPDALKQIVTAGGGDKQRQAYNLCDGMLSQGEIQSEVGLDKGSFSRTVKRWEAAGILVKIGEGQNVKLQGLYRI